MLPALVSLSGLACRQAPPGTAAAIDVSASSPAAARLAARQINASRVPLQLVADFDRVLTALEIRCTETRETSPGLVEIAARAAATATKNGHDLTPLQALRSLESSIHEGADMKIDCTDAANRLFSEQ